MNRTVRILLGLLTIGLVALTSCKKDNQEPKKNEGTTYALSLIHIFCQKLHMSDNRGINEVTIYNVSTMDWLLAVSYRNHRSYQSDRISNL